jgi:hypothetical protein
MTVGVENYGLNKLEIFNVFKLLGKTAGKIAGQDYRPCKTARQDCLNLKRSVLTRGSEISNQV